MGRCAKGCHNEPHIFCSGFENFHTMHRRDFYIQFLNLYSAGDFHALSYIYYFKIYKHSNLCKLKKAKKVV
ncbi:hypothetical protein Dret_2516 (plasmid) [Desulfohalobium retbaense DSM 5692]|uniref:Uncharacterized protein n=1 Tax=Desulfohalobium retbaense (strain ATCC 49708 / DSM 5692 / JCM 16813 / HR100) TaxID=485915 RepID=C8X5U9_DESRD|nr:hypothetical protein Dret_2516 [Desulfohalobium retbaense DSM 5692]